MGAARRGPGPPAQLAKTVLTRAAEGTKVVFTGDTSQIDAPFPSAHNNAMSVLTGALVSGPVASWMPADHG